MNCRLKPKNDRVLISPDKTPDKTEAGIIIPESAKDRPNQATVLSVGPKVENIKEGERILFGKYAGTTFHLDDESFLLIREQDVIAEVLEG